jgi:hypothetical protein
MARFYEAEPPVYTMLENTIGERFPSLEGIRFKVLMDSKTKVDKLKGRPTLAYIKLTSEVERFLSQDGHNLNGIDYIVFLPNDVWQLASAADKKRLISHELSHCFTDEEGNCKLIKHDIEDFYAEIERNQDDPMWAQSLSVIVIAQLDQKKAEEKARKKAARG